ncbi:hypothetical protein T03_9805 [Trichinella britovi]|uniref:Uncharacterized protein n=1 Tax=Trichinella britovi TaxID=45882 RepID=A0A0V1C7T0_TRIBR|nr:hypothetical protein T03_9805 [Trichinella britovi]
MLPQNTTSAELLLGMHVDAMVVQHLLHVRSFAPLLVLYENKQIVNDTEHIQYIPHILLNTPQPSSVYRDILQQQFVTRRGSQKLAKTNKTKPNADTKLSSSQTSEQRRKE